MKMKSVRNSNLIQFEKWHAAINGHYNELCLLKTIKCITFIKRNEVTAGITDLNYVTVVEIVSEEKEISRRMTDNRVTTEFFFL